MRQELVDDLKGVGTTLTNMAISNTLRRSGLKKCIDLNVPQLKKPYDHARLRFANEHVDDSEEG